MDETLTIPRQELEEIYKSSRPNAVSVDRRETVRWPFREIQWLGPYGSWGLPKKHMFFEVRCHDLSQGGISFFLPRPPASEFAVIGLGKKPNLVYYMVQMTNCNEFPGEKKQYLVGCRFVQRVTIDS
jgi:hypothetical protein